MKNGLIIKKCASCGAIVRVLKDCTCDDCGVKCCGTEMEILVPNSVDASAEKHTPQVERVEDEIYVTVAHPMEKEHYIEWIAQVKDNREEIVYLYPEGAAEARFKYVKGATVYAYCNKHGLWAQEI